MFVLVLAKYFIYQKTSISGIFVIAFTTAPSYEFMQLN